MNWKTLPSTRRLAKLALLACGIALFAIVGLHALTLIFDKASVWALLDDIIRHLVFGPETQAPPAPSKE